MDLQENISIKINSKDETHPMLYLTDGEILSCPTFSKMINAQNVFVLANSIAFLTATS